LSSGGIHHENQDIGIGGHLEPFLYGLHERA
jgi:hypothetical protein